MTAAAGTPKDTHPGCCRKRFYMGETVAHRRRSGFAWLLLFVCILGGCVAFARYIAFPVYKQPDSRLWNTWVGYPEVLRRLGRPIPVSVTSAENRKMVNIISAVGTVQYLNNTPLNVDNVGIVVNVRVVPGDHVEPGDTLLTLSTGGQEARQAKLDLDSKTASYEKAKADYDRDREALKHGLLSQSVLDATKATYLEAEADMRKSQDTLATTLPSRSEKVLAAQGFKRPPTNAVAANDDPPPPSTLTGPDLTTSMRGLGEQLPVLSMISGTVTSVNAYVGQNLTDAANKLMTIGDRLMFLASPDQRYFSDLKIGDAATIYLRAMDGGSFEGRVIRIAPIVSASTGGSGGSGGPVQTPYTFPIWLEINSKGKKLAAGMNGYALFKRDFETLAVPQSVLMRYSGGEGVVGLVTPENRVHFTSVTYSINAEGMVAIQSGVSTSDRLILEGQAGLREGDRVAVKSGESR